MRKIFITDIDGTLIHYDERDKENINAFKRLKENNHIVVACTGRSIEGVEFVEKEHSIKFDYYIVLNGAMILDSNKNIIDDKKINNNEAYEIINMIKSDNLNISMNNGEQYYLVCGDGKNLGNEDDGFKLEHLDLDEVLSHNVSAIAVHYKVNDGNHIELLDNICNDVNKRYGQSVIAYRNNHFIDIVPKGCSKGEGVKYIENLFEVDNKDIFTIGDSGNDISMLRDKDNSFTFTYAEDCIKKHAKYVIDSFSECVDNYVLKK